MSDKEIKPLKNTDCLGCRLIGTAGLFVISIFVFKNASQLPKASNRVLVNSIGTGTFTNILISHSYLLIINFERLFHF